MTDKEDNIAALKKKTWRDLIGAAGDTEGPTDVSERHDYYLDESAWEQYGRDCKVVLGYANSERWHVEFRPLRCLSGGLQTRCQPRKRRHLQP